MLEDVLEVDDWVGAAAELLLDRVGVAAALVDEPAAVVDATSELVGSA